MNGVTIWEIRLDRPDHDVAELQGLLDPAELARADAFLEPRARREFIVAHGAVRQILGSLLGVAAADIRFSIARSGKPGLVHPSGIHPLRFSLAHTDGLALLATAWDTDVGIDVECVREFPEPLDVARAVLSSEECDALTQSAPEERVPAFFAGWTRREAWYKATGLDPLDRSLNSDVTLSLPGTVSWMLHPDGASREYAAALSTAAA